MAAMAHTFEFFTKYVRGRRVRSMTMSALPPIADMYGAKRDVRFVPIADIAPAWFEMKRAAN